MTGALQSPRYMLFTGKMSAILQEDQSTEGCTCDRSARVCQSGMAAQQDCLNILLKHKCLNYFRVS